jgi:hypothetical protein
MSGGMYKPSVRMIKNARAHLYRNGVISKDVSPSYFVECLLFNLPRAVFDSRLDHLYCNIVNHLDACDYNEITKCAKICRWCYLATHPNNGLSTRNRYWLLN